MDPVTLVSSAQSSVIDALVALKTLNLRSGAPAAAADPEAAPPPQGPSNQIYIGIHAYSLINTEAPAANAPTATGFDPQYHPPRWPSVPNEYRL